MKNYCRLSILSTAIAAFFLTHVLSAEEELVYRSGPYDFRPLIQKVLQKGTTKNPLRFVIISDTHLGKASSKILEYAKSLNPDIVFHLGDRVNRGSADTSDWLNFESSFSQFARSFPFVPVEGNHESMGGPQRVGRNRFLKFFALDKPYYFIDTATCRFVILGWEFSEDDAQISWLEEALKGGADRHLFIMVHTPFYTVGHKSADEIPNKDTVFTRLFSKYGVRCVFSGHDHSYYRTVRNSVTYVVAAGGAEEKYPLERRNEAIPGDVYMGADPADHDKCIRLEPVTGKVLPEPDHYFIVDVLVQGAQIVCRAVSTAGKEWDCFTPVRAASPVPATR